MEFSSFFLWVFNSSSSSAKRAASFSSSVRRSLAAVRGDPKRPEALILGTNPKAAAVAVIGNFIPLLEINAFIPVRSEFSRSFKPYFTISLFSPVRETTSAIVARAASSPYSLSAVSYPPPSAAAISFRTTPAPHRYLKGEAQSFL